MTRLPIAQSQNRRAKTKHGIITERVKEKDLFRPRDTLFFAWTTTHVALFTGVLLLATKATSHPQLGALALAAAFLSTQIALIAHDVLHGQAPRRCKRLVKPLSFFLGNILVGLSHEWWKRSHDDHHKEPNHIEKDPDIQSIFFKVDESQLAGKRGLERFFARHQHWAFFCLIPLQALSFRKSSVKYLVTKRSGATRFMGLAGLALHLAWYVGFLILLGFPEGIVFLLIHQMVFGIYNSLIFAPNHKGMTVVMPEERLDSFTKQVITARDVKGGWIFSYISGGLDCQVAHHLFPGMSRFNLRAAQPIVEQFCHETGTPYTSMSITSSYIHWVRCFRRVSRHA